MSLTPPTLWLTEPAEALNVVAYLLGSHPNDSIVVLATEARCPVLVDRLDLPNGGPDQDQYTGAAQEMAHRLTAHHGNAAILIGYGPAAPVSAAIDVTRAALTAANITIEDALRVEDGRWWSLTCPHPACCPPQGTPFDTNPSVAAKPTTTTAPVALPNLATVEELAPTTGDARRAFAAATAVAVRRMLRVAGWTAPEHIISAATSDAWMDTPQGRSVLGIGVEWLTETLDTYRSGRILDDYPAAQLTVYLTIPEVLFTAIRRTTADDWQIRMWTDLVRRTEPDFTTGPAIALAFTALHDGNRVLAEGALRRALDTEPDSGLAQLLLHLVRRGIDPAATTAVIATLTS